MSSPTRLRAPSSDHIETLVYRANPRAKRSFNTILDAHGLFDRDGRSHVTTTLKGVGPERRVEIQSEHGLKGGAVREKLVLSAEPCLRSLSLERTVASTGEAPCREERVDFARGPVKLPDDAFPEVLLPFVLRWQPFDGERRSVHAWIVDRFVARVYCEWSGRHTLTVPAGRFETLEMVMYPDLNDWVPLPGMLTALAKPFLPKYRMWFEAADARRVVRYEGPYGPPGAPEIVLELTGGQRDFGLPVGPGST